MQYYYHRLLIIYYLLNGIQSYFYAYTRLKKKPRSRTRQNNIRASLAFFCFPLTGFFIGHLQTDTMDVCSSASLLGQQLTLIELERLSFIGPEEFVQAFAKDSPHIDSSFKDMKKTKNLESYVHWFNRLSYLVASEICKVRIVYYLFVFEPCVIHLVTLRGIHITCPGLSAYKQLRKSPRYHLCTFFSIRKRNNESKQSSFGSRPRENVST